MDEIKNKRSNTTVNKNDRIVLTAFEEKILNSIKDCPNLPLFVVSMLSEVFGYPVECKRKTELEEKLNSKNSD